MRFEADFLRAGFVPLKVHAHVQNHGFAKQAGTAEGAFHVFQRGIGAAQVDEIRSGRQNQGLLVGILKVLQVARRGVATDQNQRVAALCRLGQRGCRVGQRRAVGDRGHPRAPGDLGMTDGGQHRIGLVVAGNIASATGGDKAVHHEQVGITYQAKEMGGPQLLKPVGDDLVKFHPAALRTDRMAVQPRTSSVLMS